MIVMSTLLVLTIHSLIKCRYRALEALDRQEDQPSLGQREAPRDRGAARRSPLGELRSRRGQSRKEVSESGSDRRKETQPAQRPSALLNPAVMFSTRKTWDLGHAPCLQELWKRDVSLDASSVDFPMSDSEEDCSFLSLPTAAFPRHCVTSDLLEPVVTDNQQLLIQTLQERVCEFQTRLRSQDAGKKLQPLCQSQKLHQPDKVSTPCSLQESAGARCPGVGSLLDQAAQNLAESLSSEQEDKGQLQEDLHSAQDQLCNQESGRQALVSQLRRRVQNVQVALLDQSEEVNRLHSELGATDLEKHLEILVSENERLRQVVRASHTSLPDAPVLPPPACVDCRHSQDAEALRSELAQRERESRERDGRSTELESRLELEVTRSTELESRLELEVTRSTELESRLELEVTRSTELKKKMEESLRLRKEVEQELGCQLKECQQALSRQAAQPPQIKYVSKTVEVDSAQSKQALLEAQAQSQALQEQLAVKKRLLQETDQQLQESQRTVRQLRMQLRTDRSRLCRLLAKAVGRENGEAIRRLSKILAYEGEMERAQGQLEAEMQSLEEEKNRIIEEAFLRAESEMMAVHENLAGVRMNLLTLQPALRTLTCDYNCLKRQVQDFPLMLKKAITEAKQEICQAIEEVNGANQELLRKYKREMNLRKKCHNELVRLKGNIRVFCRVRPICQEMDEAKNMVTFDPNDDAVLHLSNKGKLMIFELDKVFPPRATQEEVFQEVQSLVTSCIDGYNVCIFAYGQTGSGKTYTMEGVPDNPGINQRALRLLFSEVSEKTPDWDFSITVSMVEIYNETLRNLLGDNPSEKLDIKICPDGSGQLYVPGLTEFAVQSVEDIYRVFDLGHMNRATAYTNLNEHSSRSHALLVITVSGLNAATGHRTSGKLNLVDLAGSERIAKSGAEGSRLREAQCINKSLSALGDVIHALRSKQAHIPFRNSRLTYLLQDSLSGDSKTLMLVQISPLESNVSESVCSLKFAQRVRSVELGPAPSARRHAENSSASSSPTHDSLELDSPPVTPMPLPLSRASSAGSMLASASATKTPGPRRRSQSHFALGKPKLTF